MPKDPIMSFWAKVKKTDGCWEWTAGKTVDGYGLFMNVIKMTRAHRFSYELHKGPIPKGMLVCHSCDNPPCTRPDHLFLGTSRDNILDAIRKGRMKPIVEKIMSEQQCAEIRKNGPDANATAIGRGYGVSHQTIARILKRHK